MRDWWQFGWCWAAARLDDGLRVHWADIRIPGMAVFFGYLQGDGAVRPLEGLSVTEDLGSEGFPTTGHATVAPGALEVVIDPLCFAPILLTGPEGRVSRFPRALACFSASDGRAGVGWVEWNQPEGLPG